MGSSTPITGAQVVPGHLTHALVDGFFGSLIGTYLFWQLHCTIIRTSIGYAFSF
jgi:hypothetical protein